MPKNVQGGQGKNMGGVPGQPDPQALMRMQQLQQMQTMGQMPPQEMNPVTPVPQIRGRVAPGQGMPPQQFQPPQGRVDPRQFAMQLAQMRAMRQPPGMGANNGIAQYQANQMAKVQAAKDAMAAAAALKNKKKQIPVAPYNPASGDAMMPGTDFASSGQ